MSRPPHHGPSTSRFTGDEGSPFTPYLAQEGPAQQFNNPFAFTPANLSEFLNPRSLRAYHQSGGTDDLEKGLRTDLVHGLDAGEGNLPPLSEATSNVPKSQASILSYLSTLHTPMDKDVENGTLLSPTHPFADRIRVFNDNRLPKKKGMSIWGFMWEAHKDPFILVLTGAAIVSLAFGIYESVAQKEHPDGKPTFDWVEGVAITAAVAIVVFVSACNDWHKERQSAKLRAQKEDRSAQVIRSGKIRDISVYDILVGDVVCINQGDLIPADGVIIECNEIECDESFSIDESHPVKKTAGKTVYDRIASNGGSVVGLETLDPFVISGTKVLEGTGTYLVTAVGANSTFGKTATDFGLELDKTPLQAKLEGFVGTMTNFGLGSAILFLLVLTFEFIGHCPPDTWSASTKVVIAYVATRMLREGNLVRTLHACQTIGNTTTICSGKTGTLTQNKMTVVAGIVGKEAPFADVAVAIGEIDKDAATTDITLSTLSEQAKELFRESVILNSTATDGENSGQFNGSKTDTALLSLIGDCIGTGGPLSVIRAKYNIVQTFSFGSARKCMGIVIKTPAGYRLYVKGASEILLGRCTNYVGNITGDLSTMELTMPDKAFYEQVISNYAQKSLRTIGLVYKDYAQWPPINIPTLGESMGVPVPKVAFDDIFFGMTIFAIVGIQDPLRLGVPEAVQWCKLAGVTVCMVTGDHVETAKAVARECGIYDGTSSSAYSVMDGPSFRRLHPEEIQDALENLRVLARASPEDKQMLVKALKDQGKVVAVTGDETNDGPALKMADVGFCMGIARTTYAKEASSLILMDSGFSSLVKALMWGRAINGAVQKFLQSQLTVNITAVIVTLVSSVLTAVQLLWVSLIMDTFAALALATDAPTPSISERPKAGLVSLRMWKSVIGQAIVQLAIILILNFEGARMFGYSTFEEYAQLRTMVFNTFVWMQIFNEQRLVSLPTLA